ncbi:unnamed protein product, partial [Rotaria magnacalcarata]
VFHDGIYQIFCSQHHEHESLENSIVPVEIRSVIHDLALNGLSVGQIRKTMEVLHPVISLLSQVKENGLKRHKNDVKR